MIDCKRVFFLIEGGMALDLINHQIAELERVTEESRALMLELGADEYWSSREDGTVKRVRFIGPVHPDFTKPDKNGSRPKKGTEWAKRFAAQKGYANESSVIANAFNIPLSIQYGKGSLSGWRAIAYPLSECGFLYLGKEGPFAMWIPDLAAQVRYEHDRGNQVGKREASFKAEFDGCRRIEIEEWELLVAQHNLAAKKASQKDTSAA